MYDILLKFYGVDWLLFVLSIWNLWLLGNGNRIGFLIGIVANFCGMVFGFMIESYAAPPMNLMFIIFNVRGYWKWDKK